MSDIVYRYFSVLNPQPTAPGESAGVVCVALQRPPKGASRDVPYRASYAFCGPGVAFRRDLARKISLGRLNCERSPVYSEFQIKEDHSLNDAFDVALRDIFKLSKVGKKNAVGHSREIPLAPRWLSSLGNPVFERIFTRGFEIAHA